MKKSLLINIGIALLALFAHLSFGSSSVAAVDHSPYLLHPSSINQSSLTSRTRPLELASQPYHACKQSLQTSKQAFCHAEVLRPVISPLALAPGGIAPYTPANLHSAYNLPSTTAASGNQTIAIVAAFDDPKAEADLAVYRRIFDLPVCTSANGCFRKVNQYGSSTQLPAPNTGWAQEISLDLDVVSAICTNCHILLVESNGENVNDLGIAVNTAVRLGATVVSNSYGAAEFSVEQMYCNAYYTHPKVAITVSTGDSGPAVNYPAVCPNVIAVGGTSLQADGTETAWSGSGGGCSRYISKPTWQTFIATNCPNRTVADVAAVADPYTGIYVYDTYNAGGWYQMGGTSLSAPLIAGVYGLAGNASSIGVPQAFPWMRENENIECLNDVPGPETVEYAYQTGLGTPDGTLCF